MNPVKLKILCLSRSYLSRLLPTLGGSDDAFEYLHIVQTDNEEQIVQSLGGRVVLNIQRSTRSALADARSPPWGEPEDMRRVTGFDWSPIYSDRHLVNFPDPIRLRIAGALQRALDGLFSEHRFTGFLSEPVALFVTHLIFYHCRKNQVRPLLWCNTYFPGHFYFAAEMEISVPVRRNPPDGEELALLQQVVGEYVNGIIGDKAGPVYHHAFSGVKQNRLDYFKQREGEAALVLRPGWTSRSIQIARLLRAIWHRLNFRRIGDFMTAGAVREHLFYLRCLFAGKGYDPPPASYSSDNVVYPLQYEPEASLLYFAPHIVDQPSFVETILRALPHGKVLWVKEHPNQFGALHAPVWRSLKKRYGNLRFIHGRQNGRNLIRQSSLVVTISSSMGMDALLLGRCLLVAGKVFYSTFTGAIRTRAYDELARELNRSENYHVHDDASANARELTEFGHHAYQGDPQPSHYLYDSRNLARLVSAIHSELRPA